MIQCAKNYKYSESVHTIHKICLILKFLVHKCICTDIFVCEHMQVCGCWGVTLSVFKNYIHFLWLGIPLAQSLPMKLECLKSKPHGSSPLYFSSAGITDRYQMPNHFALNLEIELRSPYLQDKHFTG